MFALSTIPLEDLSDTAPSVPQYVAEDDIVPKPFPIYALEGDVTAPCGYLPIYGVWVSKYIIQFRWIKCSENGVLKAGFEPNKMEHTLRFWKITQRACLKLY